MKFFIWKFWAVGESFSSQTVNIVTDIKILIVKNIEKKCNSICINSTSIFKVLQNYRFDFSQQVINKEAYTCAVGKVGWKAFFLFSYQNPNCPDNPKIATNFDLSRFSSSIDCVTISLIPFMTGAIENSAPEEMISKSKTLQ